MVDQFKKRKIWIGRYLIVVAALHTIVAFLIYGQVFMDILARGVFNTINRDPLRSAAIWFLLFGGPLLLLGVSIHSLDSKPGFTEASTLGLTMPAAIALMNMQTNKRQRQTV